MSYLYMSPKHLAFLQELEKCGHVPREAFTAVLMEEFEITSYLAGKIVQEYSKK